VLNSVGIWFALGLAIDGSDHKVRLASTRFHSPLANPCRRPGSMEEPPMSEARELARIVVGLRRWVGSSTELNRQRRGVSLAAFPARERT
jgi:hypothetical protein